MVLLKKVQLLGWVLFLCLIGAVEPAQRLYQVNKDLRASELALGVAKIILTNAAMLMHEQKADVVQPEQKAVGILAETPNETKIAASNNPKILYLLANALGIGRNAVAMYTAMTPDPLMKTPGNLFALSSSTMTLAIDSYLHIKNMVNGKPYGCINKQHRVQVLLLQIAEFCSARFAALHGSAGMCQTPKFQTSMHNLSTASEALEKLILSGAYASKEDAAWVSLTLLGNAAINTLSAVYHVIQASRVNTTTLIVPNDHPEILCPGSVCRHGMVPRRPETVRFGACQHDVCIDCTLNFTDPRNLAAGVDVACPCCNRKSVVYMAPLRRIVEANGIPGRPVAFGDILRGIFGELPGGDEWEDDWEDPAEPSDVDADSAAVRVARGIAPSRIIQAFPEGASPEERRQWYQDQGGAGEASDDFSCVICTEENEALAGRQLARLDCGHMYCLDCCARDVVGRRQDVARYACATCRGHCDLHAAYVDRRV